MLWLLLLLSSSILWGSLKPEPAAEGDGHTFLPSSGECYYSVEWSLLNKQIVHTKIRTIDLKDHQERLDSIDTDAN